jgi:hypothetical protein
MSFVNPDGVAAGGNFAKGLLGGKIDADALIPWKGFAGIASVDRVEGVVVFNFAKGFVVPLADDPNENDGTSEEENVVALIP